MNHLLQLYAVNFSAALEALCPQLYDTFQIGTCKNFATTQLSFDTGFIQNEANLEVDILFEYQDLFDILELSVQPNWYHIVCLVQVRFICVLLSWSF